MRRAVIILVCFAAASCASRVVEEEPVTPLLVPAAQPVAIVDNRVAEQQTVINELLDRVEVMNARIQRLESGSAAPEVVVPPSVATEPVASVPATAATSSGMPAQPPVGSVATSSRLAGAEVADHYRNALTLYGKGRFQEARQAFEQVFDSDRNGELADNALYWIGETYYVSGKYTEAVKYYRRIVEEFGDQNKAPDAMLKIGLAFEKSGDLALARRGFQDLVTRFPYSSPAATAKQELKRIKY